MNQNRLPRNHRNGSKRIVLVQPGGRLDARMKHLDVMCRHLVRHPVPLPMRFLHEETSRGGQQMAVYECTYDGCRCRQGWVRDRRTGKPIQLWNRQARS